MSRITSTTSAATRLSVARQPILDLKGRVFGYELLYRQAAADRSCAGGSDAASASVITGALLDLGLDSLTGGRHAFLNVTRPLLLDMDTLARPEEVVIEVLEDVPAQKLAYLRLLAALNRPDLTTKEVESLVKQDLSLTLRVLRSVNSAAYAIRAEIRSIGQALFLLGIDPIRRWPRCGVSPV